VAVFALGDDRVFVSRPQDPLGTGYPPCHVQVAGAADPALKQLAGHEKPKGGPMDKTRWEDVPIEKTPPAPTKVLGSA
jgi:hypothetical protein